MALDAGFDRVEGVLRLYQYRTCHSCSWKTYARQCPCDGSNGRTDLWTVILHVRLDYVLGGLVPVNGGSGGRTAMLLVLRNVLARRVGHVDEIGQSDRSLSLCNLANSLLLCLAGAGQIGIAFAEVRKKPLLLPFPLRELVVGGKLRGAQSRGGGSVQVK